MEWKEKKQQARHFVVGKIGEEGEGGEQGREDNALQCWIGKFREPGRHQRKGNRWTKGICG